MKPADLQPGHRIAHHVPGMNGTITVAKEPHDGTADAIRLGSPGRGRVHVDVVVSDAQFASLKWDPEELAAGAGAESFRWAGTDSWTWRLTFHPDTDVEVEP